jgi:four helix bundle suffix protein
MNRSNKSSKSNLNNEKKENIENNGEKENIENSENAENAESAEAAESAQGGRGNETAKPSSGTGATPKQTFLPQHGHYRHLRVYQVTEMIYDITYYFTQNYLKRGDRTVDQMVQAARSGKQNIAEGNQAAATSAETEIKLTNVAKASLEELLIDYEDYLRVRKLEQWGKLHPRFENMRQYASSEQILKEYAEIIVKFNDEEISNLCITLIHQAIYMLHKLLVTMQNRFVKEGGIRERMYTSRSGYRNTQNRR